MCWSTTCFTSLIVVQWIGNERLSALQFLGQYSIFCSSANVFLEIEQNKHMFE